MRLSIRRAWPTPSPASARQVVRTRPCYITFDIDALDPAFFAPGTGTPVWAASWQAAAILRPCGTSTSWAA
ncbi:MAG: arginase family protein [Paracoccaceae bacterium]